MRMDEKTKPVQRIIRKENSPEGYRTTAVEYTCPECGSIWQKTFRAVWDGSQLMNEKQIFSWGEPCEHCKEQAVENVSI